MDSPTPAAKRLRKNESTICGLLRLNPDCLQRIFSYLNPLDIIQIEEVCEGWSDLLWNSMKYLDVAQLYVESTTCNNTYPADVLQHILQKCSKTIRTFKAAHVMSLKPSVHECLQECGEFPNLEVLNLLGVRTTQHDMEFLAENCSKLKEIYLSGTNGVPDSIYEKLFNNNKYLSSVSLNQNDAMIGTCLNVLPETLIELSLNKCLSLQLNILLNSLSKFKHLKSFSFDSNYNFATSSLSRMIEILPNLLESLSVSVYVIIARCPSLENIKLLTNLKKLNFTRNRKIDNRILIEIIQSCSNLENLNLLGCNRISEIILLPLCTLSNLQVLNLSMLDISFTNIRHVAQNCNLRTLLVKQCASFDDQAAADVIEHAKNLTSLNMSDCRQISIKTIVTAINALNNQPKRTIHLELVIEGTYIRKLDDSKHKHKLLKIQGEWDESYCFQYLND